MTFNQLVISLLSLILGALLGGAVKAFEDRYRSFKESQAVAAAIRAELAALLQIIEQRRYLAALDWMVEHLSPPEYQPTPEDIFEVKVTLNYFQIFDVHCDKLGNHRRTPMTREMLLQIHQNMRELFGQFVVNARAAIEVLGVHERRRLPSI